MSWSVTSRDGLGWLDASVSVIDRLDAFQRRHPVLGFPLAVVYKFFEDSGMHLVATLAYYALVSAVPAALLLASIASGLVTAYPDLGAALSNSLLGRVPVVKDHLVAGSGLPWGSAGLLVGVAGSLYGGLGVGNAFQHMMNQVWSVPRNSRPNPVRTRLKSCVILALVIGSVLGASLIAGSGGTPGSGSQGPPSWAFPVILALTFVIFLLAMRFSVGTPVPVRAVAPGALLASFVWLWAQVRLMQGASGVDTSSSVAAMQMFLSLVVALHLSALGIVLAVELNAVLARRLFPRALLTPFTDHVDLTDADRQSYAAQARTQRFKQYQEIDVQFGERPAPAAARRSSSRTRASIPPGE